MALEVKDARELMDLAKQNGVQYLAFADLRDQPQFKFMVERWPAARSAR